jgi:hypothetical protein
MFTTPEMTHMTFAHVFGPDRRDQSGITFDTRRAIRSITLAHLNLPTFVFFLVKTINHYHSFCIILSSWCIMVACNWGIPTGGDPQ